MDKNGDVKGFMCLHFLLFFPFVAVVFWFWRKSVFFLEITLGRKGSFFNCCRDDRQITILKQQYKKKKKKSGIIW